MRYLTVVLVLLSLSVSAEEECVFDVQAQEEFTSEYISKNGDSEKGNDESGILINRNGEVIHFNRGGCSHFGISIESISSKKYTEEEFHQKVISLVSEFGSELVNVEELKTSISNKNWHYEEGYYFVKIETVTSFEMGHDGQGKVYASFYNN